jgi:uncharacterized protein YbaR (Trm112 family)
MALLLDYSNVVEYAQSNPGEYLALVRCMIIIICSIHAVVEVWSEDEEDLDIDITDELGQVESVTTEHRLTRWLVLFLLRLQAQHYIPDAAIVSLLKFLYAFFLVLGSFSKECKSIGEYIPRTMYSVRKFIGLKTTFKQLIVCPECNSVYPIQSCIERPGVSKHCQHKEFPRSQRCNFVLLKTVELASRKKVMYPNSVYCYNSLKSVYSAKQILLLYVKVGGRKKLIMEMSMMAKFGKIFWWCLRNHFLLHDTV